MEAGCGNGNVVTSLSILPKLACLRLKVSFSILGIGDGGSQVIDGNGYLQFVSIKWMAKAIIDKPVQLKRPGKQ